MSRHRSGETYEAFIERVAGDPIARTVKLADLSDNLEESRLPHPTEDDRLRRERYRQAVQALGE